MPELRDNPPAKTSKLGSELKLAPIDAWCLAIGCIIGWGAFSMPASTFLPEAGPLGAALALCVAALVVAVIALNYRYMVNEMPVEGGAYAYAARVLGRRHGFVCAWFLVLAYLALVPYNASALALVERDLFGGILEIGPHYALLGYDLYLVEIVVEVSVIIATVLLIGRGTSLSKRIQLVMGIVLVVCIVAVTGVGSATAVSQGASAEPLFNPARPPLAGVLSVLAVAPWAFVGFDVIPQTMGSMNFSPQRVGKIMISTIVVAACLYIGLNTLTALVVPEGFASWANYVEAAPDMTGLKSLPTFHAAYAVFGEPGCAALAVAVLCAVLMGIVGFSFVVSRLLCLMGQAGSLPSWFGRCDEHGSPINALVIVAIVSIVAVLVGRTALSWVVDVSSVGAAIAFAYTSAATFKHARARSQYGAMVLGLVGAVASAVFIVLLIAPLHEVGISLGPESYVVLLTWIALGVNFYNPAASS